MTKQELIKEFANEIARLRFGRGADMSGRHRPTPTEARLASEWFDTIERWARGLDDEEPI